MEKLAFSTVILVRKAIVRLLFEISRGRPNGAKTSLAILEEFKIVEARQ